MKKGDQYIAKKDTDYFGSKYGGTDVTIISVSPCGTLADVELFDGRVVSTPASLLISPEEYYSQNQFDFLDILDGNDDFGTIDLEDPPCHHPNKYMNKVTPNLEFMVCPDCKIEL